MPLLLQNPAVDQEKLITKLLDLLGMKDILAPPQPQAPPGGVAPGTQPAPGGVPPEMGPAPAPDVEGTRMTEDNLAAGGLPPGIELPTAPTPMGGPGYPGGRT